MGEDEFVKYAGLNSLEREEVIEGCMLFWEERNKKLERVDGILFAFVLCLTKKNEYSLNRENEKEYCFQI